MLYAAKCYWPGVTETNLEQVTERAAPAGLASGSTTVSFLGSLLFADEDLVLCLFQGPTRAAVVQASDRPSGGHPPQLAGLPVCPLRSMLVRVVGSRSVGTVRRMVDK